MLFRSDQTFIDGDGRGDVCDIDIDNDGYINLIDNCPVLPNYDHLDSDEIGRASCREEG